MQQEFTGTHYASHLYCLSQLGFDRAPCPTCFGNKLRHRNTLVAAPCNARSQNRFRIASCENVQVVALSCHTRNRRCVEHYSATNRHHWRKLPDNKAVSGKKKGWFR